MIDNLPHSSNDFLSKVNKAQPNKMIKEGTTLPNWKRSWTNITNSEGCNSSDIVDIQLAHVDSIQFCELWGLCTRSQDSGKSRCSVHDSRSYLALKADHKVCFITQCIINLWYQMPSTLFLSVALVVRPRAVSLEVDEGNESAPERPFFI